MKSLYPFIPGSSRVDRQSSTSTSGPSRRARRTKQHVHARDVALTLDEDISMRNLLLANINEQHVLATRLFETLSNSLSGSRRIPRSTNPIEEVSEMYARLESLTEEQARLVELARRHQQRWERLQRKRRRRQALDEKARRVLITLEQGRRELAGIIEDGSEVCRGIEMAEKGESLRVRCFDSVAQAEHWTISGHSGRYPGPTRDPVGPVYYSTRRGGSRRGSLGLHLAVVLPGRTGDDEFKADETGQGRGNGAGRGWGRYHRRRRTRTKQRSAVACTTRGASGYHTGGSGSRTKGVQAYQPRSQRKRRRGRRYGADRLRYIYFNIDAFGLAALALTTGNLSTSGEEHAGV
jgi:regulator of replication initiation timing